MRKFLIIGITLISLMGLTACTNSSDSSSSETKVTTVKPDTDNPLAYNKRFAINIDTNSNNVTKAENNKIVNKANKWVVKQNLNEYTPHYMMYVTTTAGDPAYLNENVTMIRTK